MLPTAAPVEARLQNPSEKPPNLRSNEFAVCEEGFWPFKDLIATCTQSLGPPGGRQQTKRSSGLAWLTIWQTRSETELRRNELRPDLVRLPDVTHQSECVRFGLALAQAAMQSHERGHSIVGGAVDPDALGFMHLHRRKEAFQIVRASVPRIQLECARTRVPSACTDLASSCNE